MSLYLYDDQRARGFEPFALTRPASELCAGALLTRRRWAAVCGEPAAGLLVADHLRDFSEFDSPPPITRVIPARARIANSRCIPLLSAGPSADVWTCRGRVAAVRIAHSVDPATMSDGSAALDGLIPANATRAEIPGRWVDDVWDYIRDLVAQLTDDIPCIATSIPLDLAAGAAPHVTVLGDHPLFVERGGVIEPHTVFDLRSGPALVRARATVQAFTRIVGPCAIGEAATVTADRIAASAIGEHCKVHGELNSCVVMGYSNKAHDGFVGHSYLGRWVNLGAGTITSNLKNTYGTVRMWTPDGPRGTGLMFLGSLMGDYARTGIGLRLTTGTVIGAGANVYGGNAPKLVPPFAWGEGAPFATFELDKFLDVVERQMARRETPLTETARRALTRAHARARETSPQWVVDRSPRE
jgi:UDP-N-acetylglucosamine diphosphorylase/glucosamine-1-phosphate N-acetyltransferase